LFYLHDFLQTAGDTAYIVTKNPHRRAAKEALADVQKAQVLVGADGRAKIHPPAKRASVGLKPIRK
jgi:hypothetical protein